jgi:Domain of unknown function (DUF1905)/Bacteriocin-protection, YdeI or OmpD-Associated
MIVFTTTILKFDKQGEKTGWTYIVVSAPQAKKLKPNTKVSFRVKGKLDSYSIKQVALLPMGEGDFIIPINGTMRKALGKRQGDKLKVQLEVDDGKFVFNADLIACLKDDPMAMQHYKKLPSSHQKYFSKWIDGAKTSATQTKRILIAVTALAQGKGYPEMIRMNKKEF